MALFPSTSIPSAAAGGYDLNYSCRFQEAQKSYLHQTFSSAGNRKTWTVSFWFKRSNITHSAHQYIFSADNNGEIFIRGTGDDLAFQHIGASSQWIGPSPRKYRDTSAWYHLILAVDTSQATADDRAKLYLNGERITTAELNSGVWGTGSLPALNAENDVNNNVVHSIGWKTIVNQTSFDGYMAEHIFVDGTQYGPEAFGEVDETYGHWRPIEFEGTFGSNGWHLDFANASSLGNDISGNGHHFTLSNISSHDQSTDSPTNNFCTFNPLNDSITNKGTFSEGNLQFIGSSSSAYQGGQVGTMHTSNKIYYEICFEAAGSEYSFFGIAPDDYNPSSIPSSASNWPRPGKSTSPISPAHGVSADLSSSSSGYATIYYDGGSTASAETPYNAGDIFMVAFDPATGKFWWGENGTWAGSGNPATGANPAVTLTNLNHTWTIAVGVYSNANTIILNCGQDGTFAGNKTAQGNSDSSGYGNFYYTVPSGYKALCTKNLPDPGIDKASEHFKSVTYTGNGGTQNIPVGFQPDLVWIKSRGSNNSHSIYDSERGVTKELNSDWAGPEGTRATGLTAFIADGFSLGSFVSNNKSSDPFVTWCWKGGSDASSTTTGSGTGKAYTASYNASAGFSIVSYLGNGSAGHTIPHHMGIKPQLIFVKRRVASNDSWAVYNEPSGATKYMNLDTTGAAQTGIYHWNNTEPTSSVFTLYTNGGSNENDIAYIAYLFGSVEGYSKVGSYTGNSNTDGIFVYCGFKPAYVLLTSTSLAEGWAAQDVARNPYNIVTHNLEPDTAGAESSSSARYVDFLSNGFKLRTSDSGKNTGTYLFYAVAETPFKYTTAR